MRPVADRFQRLGFSDQKSIWETLQQPASRLWLQFSLEGRLKLDNRQNAASWIGIFPLTRGLSQRDPLCAEAAAGNSSASLLLGYPAGCGVAIRPALTPGSRSYGLSLQYEPRVINKLISNLGPRRGYESPIPERYDPQNRGFDWQGQSPLQVPGLNLQGRLLFTDDEKRLPFHRDLKKPPASYRRSVPTDRENRPARRLGIRSLPASDVGQFNGFSTCTRTASACSRSCRCAF